MDQIIGKNNPRIRAIRSLHRKSERLGQNLFLIEGPIGVSLALDSDWTVEELYFEERFLEKKEGQVLAQKAERCSLVQVSSAVMKKLSTTDSPCQVLAVAQRKNFDLRQDSLFSKGLYCIAHRTSDPGNLGTLLRVAVAAGVKTLFLTGDACEITNPKVVRSSMGALFHLPVVVEKEILKVLESLKSTGIKIIAADPKADRTYDEFSYPPGVAILLGEESMGLEAELLSEVDEQVSIPVVRPGTIIECSDIRSSFVV